MVKPLVFVGMPVTDACAYVWKEVLEAVANLEYPHDRMRVHGVFHFAPLAYRTWAQWQQEARLACSDEDYREVPSAKRESWRGYANPALTTVMYVQERVRQAFLKTDCDYCLWVEADQIVTPALLDNLLATEKDIVMAATPARHDPDLMNCCFGSPFALSMHKTTEFPLGKLVECTSVGMGCTLVKRWVLEAIGWEDPPALMKKYRNGGDVAFCAEATEKLGVKPFVDMKTTAAHVQLTGKVLHYYRLAANAVERTVERLN